MWKKKPPKALIIDNCLKTFVTINQILKEGEYFEQSVNDEHKIKVSVEEETATVLFEIKLEEPKVSDFISNLKNNILTKHLPVLKISKLNRQLFWDRLNKTENNNTNINPVSSPWLLVIINSVV